MGTLRKWEKDKVLPKQLRSRRGERGWRYWTPEQIEGIKQWMNETDRRPGIGLPHYSPSPAQTQEVIHKLRKPRTDSQEEA